MSRCPACHSPAPEVFYRCESVPVHTTLLMRSRAEALGYPRRSLELAACPGCGFIFNRAFEASVHEYSPSCEESQGASDTFMRWLQGLVDRLVTDHHIRDRTVLEIGCGKGEFLALLCDAGGNRGIGYDPAYLPGRFEQAPGRQLEFRPEMWSGGCGVHGADVIACRHTLEHIPDVLDFLRVLRAAIAERTDTLVFFEVPDTTRILEEGAFWDVYYEHCSYFDQGSLCGLFRRAGFEAVESWLDYRDQYLMVIGRPAEPATDTAPADPVRTAGAGPAGDSLARSLEGWNDRLGALDHAGKRVVLWGGGSKAAAFLSQIERPEIIERVVDIHPRKQGCFVPGTGHEVVAPEHLVQERPNTVILMNSVYREEVRADLRRLGVDCELLCV